MVSTVAVTESRMALVSFSHTSIYTPVTFLIPPSGNAFNILAFTEAFTIWVRLKILFDTLN